jgi:hypothetical protein
VRKGTVEENGALWLVHADGYTILVDLSYGDVDVLGISFGG